MIGIKQKWTKKNAMKFIFYYTFFKTKFQLAVIALYLVLMVALLVFGIVLYAMSSEVMMSLATLLGGGVMLLFAVGFSLLLRSMALKIYAAHEKTGDIEMYLSEEEIRLIQVRDGLDYAGTINWSQISDIIIAPDTAYLTTADGELIILEFNRIFSGKLTALIKLLEAERVKIRGRSKTGDKVV